MNPDLYPIIFAMSNNEPDSAGDFASLLTVLGILVIATGFLAWTVYDEWKHM